MSKADFEYINAANRLKVKAVVGGRVLFEGKPGRITGATRGYLKIRLDGYTHSGCYHPTWRLELLEEAG